MADISKINVNNTDYNIKDAVARGLIWQGTQAQYDAITIKDPNVVYFITDGETVACDADEVLYDNTTSGLSATDVQDAIDELSNEKADSSSLAEVATSGSYNDLDDKPTIPAAQVNSDWNSSSGVSEILNKPNLATVATSGSYTDLSNTPAVDTSVTSGSSNLITSGAVYTAIDNLPEPMVFKGSLGTGGTITVLPIDGSADIGDTYKVITAGTYASQPAKAGDTFICDSKTSSANTWVLIPSGDEPSGTVTSIKIQANSPISVDSSSAITTSGTRTISHATSGATAGSYGDTSAQTPGYGSTFKALSATVDTYGHVTSIGEHTVKIPNAPTVDTTLSGSSNNAIANSAVNTALGNKMDKNIEKSIEGTLVTFTDGGDNLPFGSVVATILAKQSGSGTPSPSNVRTISGWDSGTVACTGTNLFFSKISQVTIDSTGTVGVTGENDVLIAMVKKGVLYNITITNSSIVYAFFESLPVKGSQSYDTSRTVTNTKYFTAPIDGYVAVRINAGTESSSQLEYGNTGTTITPFGVAVTYPFGQTVYGGNLDVTKGLLTITHGYVSDMSQLGWLVHSADENIFRAAISGIYSPTQASDRNKGITCSCYKPSSITAINSTMNDDGMLIANGNIYVRDTTYSDVTTFKNSLSNQQLVYPLATPITVQFTPQEMFTVFGQTNVTANTGDVSLIYFTDKAGAINDIAKSNTRVALNTDIPKTDLTDIFVTGTKNNTGATITKNKFFYLNGTLVVAKADISANATLTLNTNYVVATAKVLNDLYNILQTVTPTSSDNILIVQSTGQGLAPVGSTLGAKMDKANPTGTGALSLNRASGSTLGANAVAVGSGNVASGESSFATGAVTVASGMRSVATGSTTTASGSYSFVEGFHTEASRKSQHVFGEYNVVDTSGANGTVRGAYVEIVGKGTAENARSNARTLDWYGNEIIAGTLTQSSDARLKEVNAEDIPDVSDIKAIRFNWKKNIGRDFSEHIGYLAQDVEKVLPFLVKEDAEGHKTLDYIAFLVAKIDSLEKRLAELEK